MEAKYVFEIHGRKFKVKATSLHNALKELGKQYEQKMGGYGKRIGDYNLYIHFCKVYLKR